MLVIIVKQITTSMIFPKSKININKRNLKLDKFNYDNTNTFRTANKNANDKFIKYDNVNNYNNSKYLIPKIKNYKSKKIVSKDLFKMNTDSTNLSNFLTQTNREMLSLNSLNNETDSFKISAVNTRPQSSIKVPTSLTRPQTSIQRPTTSKPNNNNYININVNDSSNQLQRINEKDEKYLNSRIESGSTAHSKKNNLVNKLRPNSVSPKVTSNLSIKNRNNII